MTRTNWNFRQTQSVRRVWEGLGFWKSPTPTPPHTPPPSPESLLTVLGPAPFSCPPTTPLPRCEEVLPVHCTGLQAFLSQMHPLRLDHATSYVMLPSR